MDRSVGGPRTGPQWGSVDRGSVFSGHPKNQATLVSAIYLFVSV